MAKGNSFEAREKRNKKRSSIVKMSELRVDNILQPQDEEYKKEVEDTVVESITQSAITPIEKKEPPITLKTKSEYIVPLNKDTTNKVVAKIDNGQQETLEITESFTVQPTREEQVVAKDDKNDSTNSKVEIEKTSATYGVNTNNISGVDMNKDDFFNLNIKNDIFEGKMTTVRVYDDILDTLKQYATMKNYPIIEFTNKVITLGLEDIKGFGILEISEIKFKNNTSRSIMYNLTDMMEEKINEYINEMNEKGYRISRNVILNVIINETLKKFYI